MTRPLASSPEAAEPDQNLASGKRPRVLALARAAWFATAALAALLFVAGVPAEFALLQEPCRGVRCVAGQLSAEGFRSLDDLGLSRDLYAGYFVVLDTVFAAVWSAVAVLIFWRRSRDPVGIFTSLALLTFGTATFAFTTGALAVRQPALELPVGLLHFLGSVSFGLFLYVFPDGRFVPRWTRWVALVWAFWQVPKYFFPALKSEPGAWYLWADAAVWAVAFGTVIYGQVRRYRRAANAAQRQQIKWVVFGISVGLVILLGVSVAAAVLVPESSTPRALITRLAAYVLIYLAMLLIPLSIGVAILRYRLWDINLIINRTLVYGALTASVVLLYVLVVGTLGELLKISGNLTVSLIATGLAAVMFQPLRDRLQRGINHLMYGERHDPYGVLSGLRQRLESTLAPDAVLPAIVETVARALKLPYAAISIKHDEMFVTAAEYGTPSHALTVLPLTHQRELVGKLILAPRAPGEEFSATDMKLLEDLALQAGMAVHAMRLTTDLQRSRERLVTAREEERRRLRRDLHDGLGPQLAAQTLKLGSARSLYGRDPAAADRLLSELESDLEDALADIRRVVYDLRPPALDELGLAGAIRETAAQYEAHGLRVTFEIPEDLPPLSAAVEVAAYRIAQEAVTNVVRHADAGNCSVRLSPEAGALVLEVTDDGAGLPENRSAGVGLSSMRERAAELGGSCLIAAVPSGGTRVLARLPLPAASVAARPQPDEGKDPKAFT